MGCLKLAYYEAEPTLKVAYSNGIARKKGVQRFISVDPKTYPWQSSYSCFNNNPILFVDSKGLEGEEGNKEVQKHTVVKNDNLSDISKKYNTSIKSLLKWNTNIKDKSKIYPGDILNVSDPTRITSRKNFESYPSIEDPTGWTLTGKSGSETTISNGIELGMASMANVSVANFAGQILDKIKKDPDMLRLQNEITNKVKSDSRYGQESFYLYGIDIVGFGGTRWTSDNEDWGAASRNNPALHLSTYKVAVNELTWSLRNATVKYWAEINSDGTINLQYRLNDRLDLSGSKGRSEAYNNISETFGFGYHTVAGGNKNLQTRATWNVTIK